MRSVTSWVLIAAASAGLAACASATAGSGDDDGADAAGRADARAGVDGPVGTGVDVDAATPRPDAAPSNPDAAPMTVNGAVRLVLTEVSLGPTGGEFVEIANPTASAVMLDRYYLSDVPTYFRIPASTQTVDSADFVARFPAGSSIPARGVITVALDTAASFTTATGVAPTFSIAGGTMPLVASSGTPSLTNAGEMVALFYWDGSSDRVVDVDVMVVGVPTAANDIVNKSLIAIDGPDADGTASPYLSEATSMPLQTAAPGNGLSTKRLLPETGHEPQGGGSNGVGGDDETAETTTTTWDATFTAPTPGVVPAALMP